MNENIINILNNLNDEKNRLENKLKLIGNQDYNNQINVIKSFIDIYDKREIFDADTLEKVLGYVNSSKLKTKDEYVNLFNTLAEIRCSNSRLFRDDEVRIEGIFSELLIEVKFYYRKIFSNFKRISFEKKEYSSDLDKVNELLLCFNKVYSNELIDNESFNIMCDYIYNCNGFTDSEKISMISDIARDNYSSISRMLNIEEKNNDNIVVDDEYPDLENTNIKEDKLSFKEILEKYELDDMLNLCNSIENLFNQTKNDSRVLRSYGEYLKLLESKYDEFIKCVLEFGDNYKDDDTKEILYLDFSSLSDNYFDLFNSISEYYNVKSNFNNKDDDSIRLSRNAFADVSDVKNIPILLDGNEEGISILEDDINYNSSFRDKKGTFRAIASKLKQLSGIDLSNESFHRIKTDKYTDEFIEKYRVKCVTKGDSLVFYSKFSTNLDKIFDECKDKKIHLIYIYEVGFNDKKSTAFDDAIKRCYNNRYKIDAVVDLFNPDWEKLSDDEKNNVRSRIERFLESENIKFGHLISKSIDNDLEENISERGI